MRSVKDTRLKARDVVAMASQLFGILFSLLLGGAAAAPAQVVDQGAPADPALLEQVFPDATRFGAFEGDPPAAPAYREDQLLGYVFFTQQVVNSAGYSGKPLNVLVGLGLDGRITGAEIVEQHEPILVIGVSEEELHALVRQYQGLDIRRPIRVTRTGREENAVDAVSGATISSTVINDAILRSARAVARERGIFGAEATRLDLASFEPADWQTLVAEGSLERLELAVAEVEETMAAQDAGAWPAGAAPEPDTTFIELFFGLATPARIGRNLLGDQLYNRTLAELPEGDHLILLGGRGLYSFKGTAWRRSGVFERVQITQGEHTFTLTEDQHHRIDALAIEGAPELRELALFTLPAESGFAPDQPWRVELLVAGSRPSGEDALASFGASYELPGRYIRASAAADAEADIAEPDEPLWEQVWRDRPLDIAVLALALGTLTGILVFQDAIARRRRVWFWLRLAFLSFTLFWVGWYAAAQLSVLNVLTFADALRTEFHWEFFLLDPLLFILWSYVAVALLFWGRGVFCGWLCPFGALQELSNKAARRLKLPQYRVPFAVHERIWPIKYVIFLALFALSLGPMALAITLAEVEPFKTAIVLRFDRAWPFVVYALALLGLGLFVERAFCRYLCPLGAALAIPAKLRLFEWLKRHRQCGAPCQICAVDCPVQAIHPDGRINPNECIYCLTCQVNYYDSYVCPPMIERRTRREKRAAIVAKSRDDGAPEQTSRAAEETAR